MALQALALDEVRENFSPIKFHQTVKGGAKGQVLKQCWFAGSHSDIGGGWIEHDLADITLGWMVAQTQHLLAWDFPYILSVLDPIQQYGQEPPHDALTGFLALSHTAPRQVPKVSGFPTNESIHYSVTFQPDLKEEVKQALQENPDLVKELLPFEQDLKNRWNWTEGRHLRPAPVQLTSLCHRHKTEVAVTGQEVKGKENEMGDELEHGISKLLSKVSGYFGEDDSPRSL